MLVQEPVQSAIWHCLNHYDYNDAIFLAERLFGENGTDESLHLVATCYYRAGLISQAYHILQTQGLRSSATKYLFARCAVDLDKDFEAENVLNGSFIDPRKELNVDELAAEFGERTCFALKLLSGIYERTERRNKAIDADKKSLRLNPFLWSSFKSLCSKGESVSPEKVFDLDHVENFSHCQGTNPLVNLVNTNIANNRELPVEPPLEPAPAPALTGKVFLTSQQQQQTPATPQQLPATPQQTPVPATPQQMLITTPQNNVPALSVNDIPMNVGTPCNSVMETPILLWNHVSTPMSGVGPQMSGISLLNLTSDCDSTRPLGTMPQQPLRPKLKKPRIYDTNSPSFGSLLLTPTAFGGDGSSGVVGGGAGGALVWRLLEFSSPQMAILSPMESPQKRKPSLSVSPMLPPSRASTPSAPVFPEDARNMKRIAMAAKPENQKHSVLGQGGNVITPQNTLPTRRSSRLFGSTQSVKENSKGLNKNRISTKSPSRKTKPRLARGEKQLSELERNEKNKPGIENKILKEKILKESVTKTEKSVPNKFANAAQLSAEVSKLQKYSATGLMILLRSLGSAYLEASRYNCREAIRLMGELPEQHCKSSWVLSLMGKCHFELAEYREATKYFRMVRDQDPHRMDMLEYYSTTLWQLQDDVELSALAQDLTEKNKLDPVSWCAAGNCFSHQKEHENAIRFFQRAVQVQPRFAYAYTLLGHEYLMVEELDKALAAFRTAVRIDSRHYNAWYGIGLTYHKQERFQLTEIYYRKALAINPYSPLLMCHVAIVQHALQKTDKALQTMNAAVQNAPRNPICKFERATILHSSERYAEALSELNELKDIAPKESAVYLLLGKVHKQLGNTHLAQMNFSWASELDPKGASAHNQDVLDPALNRGGQDSRIEDDISREGEESRNQNTEEQSGLAGEDSVFGDNVPAGSSINQQPAASGVLNESDDSL